jgi:hypothetical protein
MAMTSFRRSVHFDTQKKSKSGGGNWYDQYRLPQGNATPFVLINTEYVDPNPPQERVQFGPDGQPLQVKNSYYKFRQHRRKLMKNGNEWYANETCSQGSDPHNPKPCAGCAAMDMGDKSVTVSDKFAIGIIHLSPYHRHPLYDRNTGQVRMKQAQAGQDNNGPIFSYSECTGRTCNFCKVLAGQPAVVKPKEFWPNYNPNDIGTEFAHRRYIEIGKSHLSNLEGWDSAVTSQCCSPITQNGQFLSRCSQQFIRESFNCPDCDSVVINLSEDPRTDEEIDRAIMKPYPCMKCQKGVMLREVVSCDSCMAQNRTPLQLGMFDVVLWGKRQGEGTKSQLMLQQFQSMEEFQKNLPPHIVQMLSGKSVSDIVKQLSTAYDFDKIYEPRSFEEQAKRLELNLQAQNAQVSMYAQIPGNAPAPTNGPIPFAATGTSVGIGPAPFQPSIKPNFSK